MSPRPTKTKGKKIFEFALLVFLALLAYVVLLVSCENRLIYHPYKYPDGLWDASVIPFKFEDVWFQAADGVKLHGWYVATENARATWLFFHGNAGNLTHRIENVMLLQNLNLNIFIFDYRGYGRSAGAPDEKGLLLDSEAAYQTLIDRYHTHPEKLFLFGRSLGGFFAADTATRHPVAGVILESTFTSAQDMAKKMMPLLPIGFAIRSKLDAINKVPKLKMPKLFFHGTQDEIVPFKLGQKLYDASAEPKEFYAIEGAGHNDALDIGGAPYFAKIDDFITRTLQARKKTPPS